MTVRVEMIEGEKGRQSVFVFSFADTKDFDRVKNSLLRVADRMDTIRGDVVRKFAHVMVLCLREYDGSLEVRLDVCEWRSYISDILWAYMTFAVE